ncbi:MAG: hypothetical protein ACE5HN_10795 [Nitrospiria bacterium]
MQKRLTPLIVSVFLISWIGSVLAADNSLRSIRQLANEIYRISQDMVEHGSDGHVDEIVFYGKKILIRAETLLKEVESSDSPKIKDNKGKIVASIKETIQKTERAVRLGENKRLRSALAAAEMASFRAKKTRRRLQTIK